MITVMFVCLGNICRSPMAEAVFRKMAADAGLSEEIKADSCGMSGWHKGEPPHKGVIKTLERRGISCENIFASAFKKDYLKYDYIIAMDEQNLKDIQAQCENFKTAHPRLLSYYASGGRGGWVSVPDPWYTGDFETAYRLVDEGCRGLLEYIVKNHRLNINKNA